MVSLSSYAMSSQGKELCPPPLSLHSEGLSGPPLTAAAYCSCGRIRVLLWGCGSFGLLVLAVSSSPLPRIDTWILSVLASDGSLGNPVPILRVPSPLTAPPAPVQRLEMVRIL